MAAAATCKYSGCTKPVYSGHEFCGRTHGLQYKEMQQKVVGNTKEKCLTPYCHRPKYTDFDFCGRTCRDKFYESQTEVSLEELSIGGYEYQTIINHFNKEWTKRPPAPPVSAIMKVNNGMIRHETFTTYKSTISSSTEWHYHGTSLKCDLKANKVICSIDECGVCGIVRKGFDPSLIGTNIPRYKRFGHGLYLAPNSSKCHDYTQGYSTYRAMLLCDVAPGKKHTVLVDQRHLTSPPSGYDSVYGAHGKALNYDEIVLYCSEAIFPLYVIFYTKDGIHKIAA